MSNRRASTKFPYADCEVNFLLIICARVFKNSVLVSFVCTHLSQLFDEVRHSIGSPLYCYLQYMIEALAAVVCPIRTPDRDVLTQEVYNSKQRVQQQSQTFMLEIKTR